MSEIIAPGTPFNMAAYCIAASARAHPQKCALAVFGDAASRAPAETWSYSEIEAAVLSVAAGLRDVGLDRGARIVVRLDNDSRYPLTVFGAMAAGLVPVLASSQLTPRETAFLIADSEAAAVVGADNVTGAGADAATHILPDDIDRMRRAGTRTTYAETRTGDPAFMIYTSGTTASPKGVVHAHRSALGRRPMYQGWYGIGPADRMLHAGAFNWTFTFGTGLADPWANGATAIVYTGERTPEVWPHLIRTSGATIFAAVPGVYRQMLKYADAGLRGVGALRHGLMAGESPPPGLFEDWHQATGREIHEALGMSEISTYISTAPSVPRRPGSVGKPQPGRRVAILPVDGGETPVPAGEEGLLAVHRSDPGLMLGYWKRPHEEAEVMRGDWFTGGDIATIDADGYVFHRGRSNDVIKALGYRISPLEVESVLALHPDVAEVACTELNVRDGVSVVGAFVVARPGAPHDAEPVLAFARERLAAYKCPRSVTFVDALPRTPNGKIKRSALTGGT